MPVKSLKGFTCLLYLEAMSIATQVKNVGYYDSEVEGAQAYDQATVALRGPGTEINFPSPSQRILGRNAALLDAVPLPASDNDAVVLAVQSITNAWKAGKSSPFN